MTFKKETLGSAVALAVALAAGAAQAAISTDNGNVTFTGTGAGELFFSAISRTDLKSITIDLGLTASALRANPAAGFTQTYPALASFLDTATGPVFYNVGAISNVDFPGGAAPVDDWGILSSSSAPIGQLLSTSFFEIDSAMNRASTFLNNVNLAAGNSNPALNNTVVVINPSSFAYHDGGFWGQTWGGIMPFTTEERVDRALPFYFVSLDLAADSEGGISKGVNVLDGYVWTVAADGTVRYGSSTPPVVPLPAAVWLLGVGFLGYLGLGRARQA
jgi:hypothetical protein